MALFKQKATLGDLFYSAAGTIVTNESLFPDEKALLKQDDYTDKDLLRIHQEQRKLAIVFVYLYVLELARKGKLGNFKGSAEDREHAISMAYANALIRLLSDKSIDFTSYGIEPREFLDSMDPYTAYIAKNHDHSKPDEDYLLAFEHFKKQAFPDVKIVPPSTATLAKFIRERVSKRTVNRFLKKHKITP